MWISYTDNLEGTDLWVTLEKPKTEVYALENV